MAKQTMGPAQLCEALGVDRPSEVTRVVLDIRAGHVPMLLVERIADTAKITAALQGPLIEVKRDDLGAVVDAIRTGIPAHGNLCECNGGRLECPDLSRAYEDHKTRS
jgi:hypothetical protein